MMQKKGVDFRILIRKKYAYTYFQTDGFFGVCIYIYIYIYIYIEK
jgi:hypothetical protein